MNYKLQVSLRTNGYVPSLVGNVCLEVKQLRHFSGPFPLFSDSLPLGAEAVGPCSPLLSPPGAIGKVQGLLPDALVSASNPPSIQGMLV